MVGPHDGVIRSGRKTGAPSLSLSLSLCPEKTQQEVFKSRSRLSPGSKSAGTLTLDVKVKNNFTPPEL